MSLITYRCKKRTKEISMRQKLTKFLKLRKNMHYLLKLSPGHPQSNDKIHKIVHHIHTAKDHESKVSLV